MTKDKADSIRPILRWISREAPRKRERTQAIHILREMEGIRDYKQMIISRGEAEMLGYIYNEFPEGVPTAEERQLRLM